MRLRLQGCEIDLDQRVILKGQASTPLTLQEADLLALLAGRAGTTVPRSEILQRVWGYHPDSTSKAVDVAVRRLRNKIEEDPTAPRLLRTTRGIGWKLDLPELAEVPGNVVAVADRFVGRTALLERLATRQRGLTTLLGTAGIGKTRLATEYALDASEKGRFREVWFCDLSSCHTLDEVCQRVGGDLGMVLPRDPASWSRRLAAGIAERGRVLVVLDNLEQVIEPVRPWIQSLVDLAPRAHLLATSRQRLAVAGEQVVAVPPLAPADAAQLFVERVHSRVATEELDPVLVLSVADRLQGLPLAIELAAAHVGVHSVAEVLSGLLPYIPDAARADRHATLTGAVRWSWDLLADWERAALAQSTVFSGDFSADGARSVLVPGAHRTADDALGALMDKSLLRRRPARGRHGARFGWFEFVRAFAAKQLHGDALASAHLRHTRWCGSLGEPQALDRLYGPGGDLRRVLLSDEQSNLARAVERGGNAEDVARATLALTLRTNTRGPVQQGVDLAQSAMRLPGISLELHDRLAIAAADGCVWMAQFDRAAVLLEGVQSTGYVRARALLALGTLQRRRRDIDGARQAWEEAAAICEAVGRPAHQGAALGNLANLLYDQGRLDESRELLLRALELARKAGDRRGEAYTYLWLGVNAWVAGRDGVAELEERAISMFNELGDLRQVARTLTNRIERLRLSGDCEAAVECALEALVLHRQCADPQMQAVVLGNLADVYIDLEEWDEAYERAVEAVRVATEWNSPLARGAFLGTLGEVRARRGDLDGARRDVDEAIRVLQGRRDELAKAHCRAGQVAALAGDRERARRCLSQAETVAGELADGAAVASALDRLRAAI